MCAAHSILTSFCVFYLYNNCLVNKYSRWSLLSRVKISTPRFFTTQGQYMYKPTTKSLNHTAHEHTYSYFNQNSLLLLTLYFDNISYWNAILLLSINSCSQYVRSVTPLPLPPGIMPQCLITLISFPAPHSYRLKAKWSVLCELWTAMYLTVRAERDCILLGM